MPQAVAQRLLELYGLSTLIDENLFGDLRGPHPVGGGPHEQVDVATGRIAEGARDRGDRRAELVGVERGRLAALHMAELAPARADVAHEHHGRGATAPALGDVGAPALGADGVELEVGEQLADPLEAGAVRHLHLEPVGLALGGALEATERDVGRLVLGLGLSLDCRRTAPVVGGGRRGGGRIGRGHGEPLG